LPDAQDDGALAERKRALRRVALTRLEVLPPEELARAGRCVAEHVLASPEYRSAARLGLYAALPAELPLRDLFEAARDEGRICLLPRCVAGGVLEYARVGRWSDLRAGRYGVLEPSATQAPEALAASDLVLVPGVAFDCRGRRLGRGKGYYDRTFPPERREGPRLFGAACACQMTERVPSGAQDRRMDAVVTEEGIIRPPPAGGPRRGGSRRGEDRTKEGG
jgi:5-formyltetrahydrofolate cyclo-ligase